MACSNTGAPEKTLKNSHMKIHSLLCTLGILLGGMTAGNSTTIGFGQIGGSNTGVPRTLASYAIEDGTGFTVSNGTTPNIGLYWDSLKPQNDWQVHRSPNFNPLENLNIGGLWDKDLADASIGQLDYGDADILFMADFGYSLVLNSFDFGHTAEAGTGTSVSWTFSLLDSFSNVAWTQSVTLAGGQVTTIAPNFTGIAGESYTLVLHRTSESYNSDGRSGIDNLSFNQVAIPEPGTIALSILGAGALVALRRRRK